MYAVKKVEVTQEQYDAVMELWNDFKKLLTAPEFMSLISAKEGSFEGKYISLNSLGFSTIFMVINGIYTIVNDIIVGDWVKRKDGKEFLEGHKHLKVCEITSFDALVGPQDRNLLGVCCVLDGIEKVSEEDVIAYRNSRIMFYKGDLVSFKNGIGKFIVGTVEGIKDDLSEAYRVSQLGCQSRWIARGNDSIQLICSVKDRKDIIEFN